MGYEVKKEGMTQQKWDEMKRIARDNVCGECGAELTVHTVAERGTIEVGCLIPGHHGFIERETYTEAFRRGTEVHPAIQAAIERKMIPKDELGRAMNLLALRYPDAIKDTATAALFIIDCSRLDLDPLISPAEAVPVAFTSRKKDKSGNVIEEKTTIQMIITEDGWLSMAARGCKEDWNGPPRTMRLEEYLTTLKENEGKTLEQIQVIAKEIKKSACKDENAWYYLAIGRSKSMTEDAVVPGWFTERDMKKAERGNLPSAQEPGNQARVRSIKKWVRHVYPQCRQKMKELTAEWYQRAEGIKAAQQYIDAEYQLISPLEGGEEQKQEGEPIKAMAHESREPSAATISPPKEALPKTVAPTKTPPIFKNWGELAQAAQNLGVMPSDVFKRARVKKWEDFADYRDAWNYVEEIVTERTQSPKML